KLGTDQDLAAIGAQTGSEAEAQAAAAQLNALIDAYTLGGVYTAVNQVFPHKELAALTAFTVAPVTATVVEVDPGRGIVPLPIDLLRDPSTGKLTPLAACTLAGGTLSAQGACSSAAAAGFAALDGFSTTGAGTVARIVRFTNPISVSGKSQLIGIDDVTAAALEKMRNQLPAVINASGFGSDHVAMAYVFHTQTILSTAVQLGALPYTKPATTGGPTATISNLTPAAAFTKYGVDPSVPSSNINEILETKITTFNLLDPTTGAFVPTGTTTDETINVLIATPKSANVLACAGPLMPFRKCAPLVVFRHGLGRGRADLLTVADSFAARGFVTVAIDAAKHGDRSFCTSGQATITLGTVTLPQCVTGTSCTTALPPGAQAAA